MGNGSPEAAAAYANAAGSVEQEYLDNCEGDEQDCLEKAAAAAAFAAHCSATLATASKQFNLVLAAMRIDPKYMVDIEEIAQTLVNMWHELMNVNTRVGRLAKPHDPTAQVGKRSASTDTRAKACEHCKVKVSHKHIKTHEERCGKNCVTVDAPLVALMVMPGVPRDEWHTFLTTYVPQGTVTEKFIRNWLAAYHGDDDQTTTRATWMVAYGFEVMRLKSKPFCLGGKDLQAAVRAFCLANPHVIFENRRYYEDRMKRVRRPPFASVGYSRVTDSCEPERADSVA
jgi:hypothetical protein